MTSVHARKFQVATPFLATLRVRCKDSRKRRIGIDMDMHFTRREVRELVACQFYRRLANRGAQFDGVADWG